MVSGGSAEATSEGAHRQGMGASSHGAAQGTPGAATGSAERCPAAHPTCPGPRRQRPASRAGGQSWRRRGAAAFGSFLLDLVMPTRLPSSPRASRERRPRHLGWMACAGFLCDLTASVADGGTSLAGRRGSSPGAETGPSCRWDRLRPAPAADSLASITPRSWSSRLRALGPRTGGRGIAVPSDPALESCGKAVEIFLSSSTQLVFAEATIRS